MTSKKILAASLALFITVGQGLLPVSANEMTESDNRSSLVGNNSILSDAETSDAETTDEEDDGEHPLGDVNGDDSINVTDIALLSSHLRGIKPLEKHSYIRADLNFDGALNATDIAKLAAHINGIKAIVDPKTLPMPEVIHSETTNFSKSTILVNKKTEKITWQPVAGMPNYTLEFKGKYNSSCYVSSLSIPIAYDQFDDGVLTLRVIPSREVQSAEGKVVRDHADGYEIKITILPEKIEGNITAEAKEDHTKLSWKAAEFASSYNVYLINDNNKEQLLDNVRDTSYLFDNSLVDKKAKIKIVPVNSIGTAEAASEVSFKIRPPAPVASEQYRTINLKNATFDTAVLYDCEANEIIAGLDHKEKMYPASMTKLMTILVAAENIKDMKAKYKFTEHDIYSMLEEDASMAGFQPGDEATMEDLMYATILPSGADGAIGLANYIAGTEKEYVKLMNEKADDLGLINTHFANVTGLHDDDHYSCSQDIAVITKACMENKRCRDVLCAYAYTTSPTKSHLNGIYLKSGFRSKFSGYFIDADQDGYEDGKLVCGKTGFTNEAMYTLSTVAEYNGKRYISVVTKCDSTNASTWDTLALLENYLPGAVGTD